jgi:single-stranded-DNA-specific exonuclease
MNFGGHRLAAGFTVSPELIEELNDSFERTLSQEIDQAVRAPDLLIDAEVTLGDIDYPLLNDLSLLEPYGMGNPRPLFLSRNVAVCDRRIVGGDSLKLRVKEEQVFDAIGFRMAGSLPLTSGSIDLVFTPQLNHWTGSPRIELEMKDLIPHS